MGLFDNHACKGKEWKAVLQEWLNLLKLMKNPKSFYWSQFLKEVFQNRFTQTFFFWVGGGGYLTVLSCSISSAHQLLAYFMLEASLLKTLFCVFGRLMEENDPKIQVKVLDCLLTWKEGHLVPYDQHLRNLISSKNLREELTTWNLSREAGTIEECHRIHLVPLVIRLLMPKVRMLKELASRKVYLI